MDAEEADVPGPEAARPEEEGTEELVLPMTELAAASGVRSKEGGEGLGPVQAALRPHSSSIFKLFSTLHLNKIRRLCSLNMHMINILRLIDFMRTNPNPRRSSCSLPLLINMLSIPESNLNSASTPPYSSRALAALQARSHPQVSLN